MRSFLATTLYCCLALTVLSCGGPERVAESAEPASLRLRESGPATFADWMHSPLRPGDHEAVTFSADVTAASGIASIELYVYEYELYRNREGLQSQRARTSGQWGKVRSWDYPTPQNSAHVNHVYGLGFGKHTRVEYIFRVTDAQGEITDRLARFDAGASPWPQDKVLLYSASRRPMSHVIDVGFFRDVDYGDDRDAYHADLEAMINHGFLSGQAFGGDRSHWAFYTTDRSLDGKALAEDITNDDRLPEWLKDFSIPGIDAFCLVHREDYTDRSLLLENFHSLSNNLFSAEAHNFGTAVHECGHAIFHLSDEYGGCACFQTHSSSNVFRERTDCAEWNVANGFPADDCFELLDMYDRPWYSAEEPTFFTSAEACREHNAKLGVNEDSCRTFVNVAGEELFWAFESTCIMHDDGDDLVRPFQRACRRVIDDFYERLTVRNYDIAEHASHGPGVESARGDVAYAESTLPESEAFAKTRRENIYGYEPVVMMSMTRQDELWSLEVGEATMGIPTSSIAGDAGEVVMRVLSEEGGTVAQYNLSQPGAVHVHAEGGDDFQTPTAGTVRVAVPARGDIARVVCEFDADRHDRSADPSPAPYRDAFIFEVAPIAPLRR